MELARVEVSPVTTDCLVHPEPIQGTDPKGLFSRDCSGQTRGPISGCRRHPQQCFVCGLIWKGEVLDLTTDPTFDFGL